MRFKLNVSHGVLIIRVELTLIFLVASLLLPSVLACTSFGVVIEGGALRTVPAAGDMVCSNAVQEVVGRYYPLEHSHLILAFVERLRARSGMNLVEIPVQKLLIVLDKSVISLA